MEHSNSEAERTTNKRHIKMWVTDAVAMPNVHKMALSTTNRDIYFYDMSTPIYTSQFHLCGECNKWRFTQQKPVLFVALLIFHFEI